MHSSCDLGMRAFTPFGGIGVALFLILSGYGLTESYKKKGCDKYWSNKIRKIWFPYIIVLTIVNAWHHTFTYHSLLQYFCIDSPFWYISFLFYNYVVFYVCHKLERLHRFRFLLFALWAVLLFLFDTRIRAEQSLCFMTGMWLSENKTSIFHALTNKKSTSYLLTVLLLAVSFGSLMIKQLPVVRDMMEHISILQSIIELLIKFPFALAVILFFTVCSLSGKNKKCWKVFIGNRFLAYCSTISLELYMIHFSIRELLDKEYPIPSMIFFLMLSFVLSTVLYYSNKYTFLWKK